MGVLSSELNQRQKMWKVLLRSTSPLHSLPPFDLHRLLNYVWPAAESYLLFFFPSSSDSLGQVHREPPELETKQYCPKGNKTKEDIYLFFFPLKQNFNFVIIRELKLEYPDCSQHISKPLTLVLLHYSGSATSPFFFSTYEKCYVEMFSDYTQLPSRKAPVIPPVAYLSS